VYVTSEIIFDALAIYCTFVTVFLCFQKLKLENSLKECKEKYAEEQSQVWTVLCILCAISSQQVDSSPDLRLPTVLYLDTTEI